MHLSNVRFHNGGYCWQFARLAGAKSWKPRKFHAVFVTFEHPVHGLCTIDSGYGPAIRLANRTFQGRLLSTLLPIPKRQSFDRDDYLSSEHRINPAEVAKVFVSHFHADHIGGLSLFSDSQFVYRDETYRELVTSTWGGKLQHGFLQGLLPGDFVKRGIPVGPFISSADDSGLSMVDFFDDGTLTIVDLPGHAIGHTGYLMRISPTREIFYVVDAFWDREAWEMRWKLPWISSRVAHSSKAYLEIQERIRRYSESRGIEPIACHCPATQKYVETPPN